MSRPPERLPHLMFMAVAILTTSSCSVHSVRTIEHPAAIRALIGKGDSTEVRLISATGASTGWLPSARLVMVRDNVCLQATERPWKNVEAVRVSNLTDANISAILVDLPRSIRVVHLGHGEIRLETGGRDLSKWLRSVAHDPVDIAVPRYHVMAWQVWLGPLTWSELARAAQPMLGWPIAGTTAEVREVNAAASVGLTVAAVPVVLLAAGISVVSRARVPFPSDAPPRQRQQRPVGADPPGALVDAILEGERESPGTWSPRPCDLNALRKAKP
jgi:hypothetical protein